MIRTPFTRDIVRGVAELEPTARGVRPHRLPEHVRTRFPDPQLLAMEAQPAGARIAVRTSATRLELVTHPTRLAYRGAHRPRGRVDVLVDGELHASDELTGGDTIEVDLRTGERSADSGPSHTTVVSGVGAGEHLVELWLPHNEALELVALRSDAPLAPDDAARPVWLHHGSSISHGSNAATPSATWPAIAARRAGVELRSLGFGGSALADHFVAQVMRDAPADVLSVKLGINIVNLDAMRVRTLVPAVHGFLDTIRDGHPDAPLLVVSPIFAGIHERTPGPGAVDPGTLGTDQVRFVATGQEGDTALGRLTLEVVRETLAELVARRGDDANLHLLDGLRLYGAADAERMPLPDGLHPGPEAHRVMGERFADLAFGPGGPLARP